MSLGVKSFIGLAPELYVSGVKITDYIKPNRMFHLEVRLFDVAFCLNRVMIAVDCLLTKPLGNWTPLGYSVWIAIPNQNHSTSEQLLTIRNPNMFGIRAPTVIVVEEYFE